MYFSSTVLLLDAVEPQHPNQPMQTVSFAPDVPTGAGAPGMGTGGAGTAAMVAAPSPVTSEFLVASSGLHCDQQESRFGSTVTAARWIWANRPKEKHAEVFLMLIHSPGTCLPHQCVHVAVACAGSRKHEGR